MSDIHPNDIGLATYADVGNVAKLKTAAKIIVEAINELYENKGESPGSIDFSEKQIYVDGEDNVIFGENNIVYGSGNLIVGSGNTIVGNGLCSISNENTIYKNPELQMDYQTFDENTNRLYFTYFYEGDNPENLTLPFKEGDKVVMDICNIWSDENWEDTVYVYTGPTVCEITEVNIGSEYMVLSGMTISSEPPDDVHCIEYDRYITTFVPLNEYHIFEGTKGSVCIGGAASGENSVGMNSGSALGNYSFAANGSQAHGNYSSAFNYGRTTKYNAFAANYGRCYGEFGAAFNYGLVYSPNSFCIGYNARIFGRPLKCTEINYTSKALVIDSSYSLNGIKAGSIIRLRCFNKINAILYAEVKVKKVSGNIIYLEDGTNLGGTGDYAYQLFPDSLIFAVDTSTSYANASQAGGYYTIGSDKYTIANGYYTIAAAEGANIWGKYGIASDKYSLALANGTGHTTPGLAFKVLSDGSVHADAEYTTPCADYAEYFEWEDGNPDAEDRAGYFVKLSGDKIVKCGEFDKPLGIVSATPAIIGDSGELHWRNKFVTDDFGRIQYHDVVIPAEYDEDGKLIIEEHMERQPVINPEWNSFEEYIPRKLRPEWSAVGVLGKLVVYDDGTLKSGDICRTGAEGIAVKSIEKGYPVLKRISEDKILIWFKG